MIIYMYNTICFTNRNLCPEDFLKRLKKVAASHLYATVLREKDLSETEYLDLATKTKTIYDSYGARLILHNFPKVARQLNFPNIHLPLPILMQMSLSERNYFQILGASCHSVEDALLAEQLGCTYLTAGHIYETNCKPGLPPRGLDFLREVTQAVSIPVWGIGGITPENLPQVLACGAAGGCMMSEFMK